jgi:membrane protein required for colicin V production
MGQISQFDILFAAIILLSTTLAFFKGVSREIIGIGVIILGFALAVLYHQVPAAKLVDFGCSVIFAELLGFLGIFLGCFLLGTIASFIADRFLKAVKLKWIDRLMGAIFGFLRGWFFSAIVVLALTAFPAQNSFTSRSLLVPYLLGSAGLIIHMTPDDLKEKFEERSRQLINYWNNVYGSHK